MQDLYFLSNITASRERKMVPSLFLYISPQISFSRIIVKFDHLELEGKKPEVFYLNLEEDTKTLNLNDTMKDQSM